MIEAGRLDALSDALQRRITNLEYAQRQEKVEELLLILRTDLDDYEKNAHNADSLGKLFGSLQNYMEKTLPERIVLAVKYPSPHTASHSQSIPSGRSSQASLATRASSKCQCGPQLMPYRPERWRGSWRGGTRGRWRWGSTTTPAGRTYRRSSIRNPGVCLRGDRVILTNYY
jgi:hypothetical protein